MSDIKQGKWKKASVKKVKGESKKEQGKSPKTGNLGIGDAFAIAVKTLTEKKTKEKGFLGVSDKLLNPLEYVDKEKLHCDKKSKK